MSIQPLFSQGIVCPPGSDFARGQTDAGLGEPDLALARRQHAVYCEALEALGVELTWLPPLDNYPDSCFVEDTAILADGAAIICRPGHVSRQGEEERIVEILRASHDLHYVREPGTVDGGDVLRIGRDFLIGQSQRTNTEGVRRLQKVLRLLGFKGIPFPVGEGLHLKSAFGHIGGDVITVSAELKDNPLLIPYRKIPVNKEELYAANVLSVNGGLLMAAGFPRLEAILRRSGLRVIPLDMSEFRKMDGSLTCLSLLW